MSTNENLSMDASLLPALVGTSPLLAGSTTNPGWSGDAAEVSSAVNVSTYLHAFRRHWLVATTLGLISLAMMMPLAWYLRGPHYEAYAVLQIQPTDPRNAFDLGGPGANLVPNLFDIYKDTQSQFVTSRFVLISALRKPEIAALPSVKKHEPDTAGWLSKELKVLFPNKAEIMTVGFAGNDPDEAAALVNAVVKAYLSEVVEKERYARVERMARLEALSRREERGTAP